MNKIKNDVIPSEITKITLNEATYKNVEFFPTLVNFFFGKNGAGKTTISNCIKNNQGVEWRQGKTNEDYEVLVYNKDFIDKNLQNYDSLPGVYTLAEKNIEIQQQIDIKTSEKEKINNHISELKNNIQNEEDELLNIKNNFINDTWKKTVEERNNFKLALKGFLSKKTDFTKKLISVKTTTDKSIDEISALYNTAFNDNSKLYNQFNNISNTKILDQLDVDNILDQIIVNSSDTTFSRFINSIGALNWVEQGYKEFHNKSNGDCPYCQQKLPSSFIEDMKKCYDEDYKKSIDKIVKLKEIYINTSSSILNQLKNIPDEIHPKIDIEKYKDKMNSLRGIVTNNIQIIDDKLNNPNSKMSLEKTSDILKELFDLINEFNDTIRFNNEIVSEKKEKQKECSDLVWNYLATKFKVDIESISKTNKDKKAIIKQLGQEKEHQVALFSKINKDITNLSKHTLNTKETVININKILKDCGFESFKIEEKDGTENVYNIVRPDGTPAKNLSEGERNFIAFLYFYNIVKGKIKSDDAAKDKIVVIDDPVSSMDSNSLFIISSLIRELIDICSNNAIAQNGQTNDKFIKQIFLLTHNAYFHNEISYNRVKNHTFVNLYLISKISNSSTIKACLKEDPISPSVIINYSPVQNSYTALWSEYNEVTSPIALLSVIRKILEYYFLQMCGYDGSDLRKIILENNKDKFIKTDPDGKVIDNSDYQLAQAMLSYIKIQGKGFNDGYYFTESQSDDINTCKKIFKLIFNLMEQNQHYKMMMNSTNAKGEQQ